MSTSVPGAPRRSKVRRGGSALSRVLGEHYGGFGFVRTLSARRSSVRPDYDSGFAGLRLVRRLWM